MHFLSVQGTTTALASAYLGMSALTWAAGSIHVYT